MNKKFKTKVSFIALGFLIFLVLATGAFYLSQNKNKNEKSIVNQAAPVVTNINQQSPIPDSLPVKISGTISEPISKALSRITKKPFGLHVSPGNSPVSPEKFSGYHTGVDFETSPDEQKIEVQIYTICSGPLVLKKFASGYGGLVVQQCQIKGSDVTVIYGHLRLNSITAKLNQALKSGDLLGVLGTGYSNETDGERKHLHLGIHKGTKINILGYVQNRQELNQWIDAKTLLE